MGLNIMDIVALAKQGYKPSDVKELIEMASSKEDDPAPEENAQTEKPEEHDAGKEQPEEAPNKVTEDSEDANVIDYKKKVEELEAKISKLQADNIHKDTSDNNDKSDEDIVNEVTKMFM